MVLIKTISCDANAAVARVCRFSFESSVKEDFFVIVNPVEFSYAVKTMDGEPVENFRMLSESVRSEFFPVFLTLEKTWRSLQSYCGDSILNRIESSEVTVMTRDGVSSAVNIFRCDGEEYAAAVIWNLQEEIPDYTFSVFKGNELIEEYKALYQAIDSRFYPVLAEMDEKLSAVRDCGKKEMEKEI